MDIGHADTAGTGTERRLARAADPSLWLLCTATSRTLAERTVETFTMRARLLVIAARYGRCGLEHRAGHAFEVLQTWSFNLDAIRHGVDARAEWVGAACGAADIRIVDAARRVLAEVQTKMMDVPSATAAKLGAGRYAGMRRVVASDKVDDVRRFLAKGRRNLNPGGVDRAGFADAEVNLSDRIEVGGARSTPVSRAEVHRIAAAPRRWATARAAGAAGRQVGVTAATGAGFGALVGGGMETVGQCTLLAAGETTPADAARSVAVAAGTGAARSGLVAGLGEAVRIAARGRLAGSALPLAVASVAVDVGVAGVAYARGEADATEFAVRGGESVLGTVAAGACAALGQALVPVPGVGLVLGGVVGGVVGPLAASTVGGWVRSWTSGADGASDPVVAPDAIEAVAPVDELTAQVGACVDEMYRWLGGLAADVAPSTGPDPA